MKAIQRMDNSLSAMTDEVTNTIQSAYVSAEGNAMKIQWPKICGCIWLSMMAKYLESYYQMKHTVAVEI